jgi:hypothetical protein
MPETAWLRRNPWITDHEKGGDAGLYDLLLNPRDVAFTVPAFNALIAAAGLRIVCLVEPLRYDPLSYLSDPKLRPRIEAMDTVQRAALAEAITGNMGVHIAYCVRTDAPVITAPWDDPTAVPCLRELDGAKLAAGLPRDGVLRVIFDGLAVPVPLPRLAGAILSRIDGKRCIGEIGDELAQNGTAREVFTREFQALVGAMEKTNRLLISAP